MAEKLLELGNIHDERKIEIYEENGYIFYGGKKKGKTATLLFIAKSSITSKKRVLFVDMESRFSMYSAIKQDAYSCLDKMVVIEAKTKWKYDSTTNKIDYTPLLDELREKIPQFDVILFDSWSFPYDAIPFKTPVRRCVEKFARELLILCKGKTLILTTDSWEKTDPISKLKIPMPKVPDVLITPAEKLIKVAKELEINMDKVYHCWNFHTAKIPFVIDMNGVIDEKNVGW